MPLFGRKREEPIDPEARSPELGVKYKDLQVMGQLLQAGADLHQPRHALYFLYFGSAAGAEAGAVHARAAGYSCEVRPPLPEYPEQWSLVCERPDAMIDPPGVIVVSPPGQGDPTGPEVLNPPPEASPVR